MPAAIIFRWQILRAQWRQGMPTSLIPDLLQAGEVLLNAISSQLPRSIAVVQISYWMGNLCTALDQDEAAERYFRHALQISEMWHIMHLVSLMCTNLADIYLKRGEKDLARRQIAHGLHEHWQHGQEWQLLGEMYHKSYLFRDLLGSLDMMVAVQSMVYHHPDATGGTRG